MRAGHAQAGDGARGRRRSWTRRARRRAWWSRPPTGSGPTVVVLPGPPRELQAMWPDAVATEAFRAAIGAGAALRAAHAAAVRHPRVGDRRDAARGRGRARRGAAGPARDHHLPAPRRRSRWWCATSPTPPRPGTQLLGLISARHGDTLFSTDGSSVDDQVAALLAGRRIGARGVVHGRPAGRAPDRAPAAPPAYVAGGVVSYSNEAKVELLGVDPGLIERHGAVSPEVAAGDGRRGARALRRGRRRGDHRRGRPGRRDRARSRSGTSASA